MKFLWPVVSVTVALLCAAALSAQSQTYLGFDRNDYPGDANLKALRQSFSYTSYWLNNPPAERTNTWAGHRGAVESAGFGFLVLFNGRLYGELKTVASAAKLGQADARAAAAAARREGFPAATVIFLDQEQGGRMLPEQRSYIYAWVDAVNDACPPSPGCSFSKSPPSPAESGVGFAEVWQFAQSPQRKDVAGHCTNYNRDGNCYPPGVSAAQGLHVDVNTATSSDPSHGRSR